MIQSLLKLLLACWLSSNLSKLLSIPSLSGPFRSVTIAEAYGLTMFIPSVRALRFGHSQSVGEKTQTDCRYFPIYLVHLLYTVCIADSTETTETTKSTETTESMRAWALGTIRRLVWPKIRPHPKRKHT